MAHVGMHEAKTQLSRLVKRAQAGEEIVIAVDGKPAVKLVPVGQPRRVPVLGIDSGIFTVPDDFNELSEDELGAFETGDLTS